MAITKADTARKELTSQEYYLRFIKGATINEEEAMARRKRPHLKNSTISTKLYLEQFNGLKPRTCFGGDSLTFSAATEYHLRNFDSLQTALIVVTHPKQEGVYFAVTYLKDGKLLVADPTADIESTAASSRKARNFDMPLEKFEANHKGATIEYIPATTFVNSIDKNLSDVKTIDATNLHKLLAKQEKEGILPKEYVKPLDNIELAGSMPTGKLRIQELQG